MITPYLLIQPFGRFDGHYSAYTRLLAEGLLNAGAEIHVLSSDGFVEDWPADLRLRHIQGTRSDHPIIRLCDTCFARRWPSWLVRTFVTARWAFRHAPEYQSIHFIDATWTLTLLLWFAHRRPRNVVVTIAGATSGNSRRQGLAGRIRDSLDSMALRYWLKRGLNAIIHSPGVQGELVRMKTASTHCKCLHLIPWGVTFHEDLPSREEARRAIGYGDYTGDLFLFFGHVRPVKGIEDFIAALRHLPMTFKVIVAGPTVPGYEMKLKNAIEDVGWQSQFDLRLQFVPSSEVALYCRAANVSMLNYRHFQGASGVLSLALEYQLPVIASDYGQIGCLVRNHGFGVLCQPGDVSSLTQAIKAFLSASEADRQQFCRSMKGYAKSHSWMAVGAQHVSLYRKADVWCPQTPA